MAGTVTIKVDLIYATGETLTAGTVCQRVTMPDMHAAKTPAADALLRRIKTARKRGSGTLSDTRRVFFVWAGKVRHTAPGNVRVTRV